MNSEQFDQARQLRQLPDPLRCVALWNKVFSVAELRLVLSYIQRVGLPNLQVHFCKSSATSQRGERTSASCTSSTTSSLSTNLSTSSILRWLTMGRKRLRADHVAPVFRKLGEREVKAQRRNVLCLRGRMHAPGSAAGSQSFLSSGRPRGSAAALLVQSSLDRLVRSCWKSFTNWPTSLASWQQSR